LTTMLFPASSAGSIFQLFRAPPTTARSCTWARPYHPRGRLVAVRTLRRPSEWSPRRSIDAQVLPIDVPVTGSPPPTDVTSLLANLPGPAAVPQISSPGASSPVRLLRVVQPAHLRGADDRAAGHRT
jgi:hypothetical protein